MRSGALGWLNRLSFIAHVLAAGFWLGSLPPLIASFRLAADQTGLAIKLMALRRFSRLGHAAVVIVLATGLERAVFGLNRGGIPESGGF
jgi:putative copper resistance protein D